MPTKELLYLAPWHKLVRNHHGVLEIAVSCGKYTLGKSTRTSGALSGYYAKYREGTFIFIFGSGVPTRIGWCGKIINCDSIDESYCLNGYLGQEFYARTKEHTTLSFSYHTVYREPWRLITDIIFQDDDWLMVCDLPGVAQTFLESGQPNLKLLRSELLRLEHELVMKDV